MLSNSYVPWLFSGLLIVAMVPRDTPADVFDGLEVHGFATQGFVKTSANSFFGDSENGSFDFRELGINATLEPTPNVRLSGQLLSRQAGDMYSGAPRVDFALADVSFFSSHDAKFNMLFGRVKNPLGLYNDTRDVAFTRPGIFLPQTVYFQRVRSLALSADGVAVRSNRFSDLGNLEMQIGFGKPFVDENVEYAYLGSSFDGDFEPDGLSGVGRLMVTTHDERMRLAVSAASTSLTFRPRHADLINSGSTDILYMIASGQYVAEDWAVTAEYLLSPSKFEGYENTLLSGQSPTLEGYYAQVSWNVRSDIELMMRYEEGYMDKSDRDGSDFSAATGMPSHSRYLKAVTVGVRWDLNPNVMFRAEYQRNNGTLILSNRENTNPNLTDGDWDMFSISASYRF